MTVQTMQNFLIEIEGKAAGRFVAFSGGTTEAEVVTTGRGPKVYKHLSSMNYQDMQLTCGTGMSRGFYDWIGNSLGGAPGRKSGAIVAFGKDNVPMGRLEFHDALITELALPSLDHSQKKAAFMTVRISPESTRATAADISAKPGVYAAMLPKSWNISDFRLSISGLESECAHVFQIEGLKLGQKVKLDVVGNDRNSTKEASGVEFSNLNFRIPENHAAGFYKWFDDFVVNGNNGPQAEKKGTLEFFAPSSSKPYFGIDFEGLGIFKAAGSSGFRGKTGLPINVGLYCESMKFYAGAAAVA